MRVAGCSVVGREREGVKRNGEEKERAREWGVQKGEHVPKSVPQVVSGICSQAQGKARMFCCSVMVDLFHLLLTIKSR